MDKSVESESGSDQKSAKSARDCFIRGYLHYESLADFADYAEAIRMDFHPDGICVIRVICETLTVFSRGILLYNRQRIKRG